MRHYANENDSRCSVEWKQEQKRCRGYAYVHMHANKAQSLRLVLPTHNLPNWAR